MFFAGEYRVQLDEKNRTRIPNKLRSLLGENVILCGGVNGCAFLMNYDELASMLADLSANTKLTDIEGQKNLRKLSASVYSLVEDAQGRFVLPPRIKELINAKKGLVFLGVSGRIELWAEEKYDSDINPTNDELNNIWGSMGM